LFGLGFTMELGVLTRSAFAKLCRANSFLQGGQEDVSPAYPHSIPVKQITDADHSHLSPSHDYISPSVTRWHSHFRNQGINFFGRSFGTKSLDVFHEESNCLQFGELDGTATDWLCIRCVQAAFSVDIRKLMSVLFVVLSRSVELPGVGLYIDGDSTITYFFPFEFVSTNDLPWTWLFLPETRECVINESEEFDCYLVNVGMMVLLMTYWEFGRFMGVTLFFAHCLMDWIVWFSDDDRQRPTILCVSSWQRFPICTMT
jgi:hypothetical protein